MENNLAGKQKETAIVPGFGTVQGFESLQRIATLFSKSTIVPDKFKNNVSDCAIAIEMAGRLKASPLMVMQNLYIVYGTPSWSSKFLISTFNQCGRFEPITYREVGKKNTNTWGMQAISADLRTGQALEGPVVTIEMAKAEGWYNKNGSKWRTIPELMLRYRAAAFLIRTTAPEISMGLMSSDEVEDSHEEQLDIPTDEIKKNANTKTIDVHPIPDDEGEPDIPETPRPEVPQPKPETPNHKEEPKEELFDEPDWA